VTQEQPTEHAEIAFAEFTYCFPTTPRRDDFLSQFDDLAFLYVFFERISTLEVGMTSNDPVAMHYTQRTSHDGKQRPNASSNLGDP
jgi:hypothetical protein